MSCCSSCSWCGSAERGKDIRLDYLIKAVSPAFGLRLSLAEATVAAKALEARHLCGPTSALVLAESLVAVALLSADAVLEEEAVSLRLHLSGPLRGVLVEATGGGHLRGFTHAKVLNDLDGADVIVSDPALGSAGSVQVVFSLPGTVVRRTALSVAPPRLSQVLARYFNFSLQVPTGVALSVRADSGGVIHAAGMCVQRTAGGSQETFVRALEKIEDGTVRDLLPRPDCLALLGEALRVSDFEQLEKRGLQFRCRCTKEKTLSALEVLPGEELQKLVDLGQDQRVFCHMCSQEYTASPDQIRDVLRRKTA